MLMDRLTEPLRLFASLCGVVILCALSRSSADGAGGNMSGVFSAVGVLAGAGMTTAAISGALRDTLDVLSAASEFIAGVRAGVRRSYCGDGEGGCRFGG